MTPKRKSREAYDPEWDCFLKQSVNDIVPYFVFIKGAQVRTSKTIKRRDSVEKQTFDNFYSGFCMPEAMYVERIDNEHVFFWQDTYVFVPCELLEFVDHEGIRWSA